MNSAEPSLGFSGALLHVGGGRVSTTFGSFRLELFHDAKKGSVAMALIAGDPVGNEPLVARVHSSCVTSETLLGCDCDCAQQLDAALAAIASKGRGILFYLMQEGRGAGLIAKARDRMIVQSSDGRISTFEAYAQMGFPPDLRSYEEVFDICRLLGVEAPLVLLTNNPAKVASVEAAGVAISDTIRLAEPPSSFNAHYLAAKRASGHQLDATAHPDERESVAPGAVELRAPMFVGESYGLVLAASYLLPIVVDGTDQSSPHWFRMEAYIDVSTGQERMALHYCDDGFHDSPAKALVRIQGEDLLARLPVVDRPTRHEWVATVQSIVERGAGCVVFRPARVSGFGGVPEARPDRAAHEIVRAWSLGRVLEPLASDRAEDDWWVPLADSGQSLLAPRPLSAGNVTGG